MRFLLVVRCVVALVVPCVVVGACESSAPASRFTTGQVVVNPQFDIALSFREGLAAVGIGGFTGKGGFIDKTGRMVVNPQFDNADSFSEGLARVRIGGAATGRWGFVAR